MQEIQVGKTYKHYKGNIYKIIAVGKNSENLEEMIVYQSVNNHQIWIRPASMWNETINNSGELRFTLID